jgi:8-oxo-dGTP diphosphatase
MKTEISAGGVIVTRGDAGWYVLLMKDMNGTWTFPKGRLEKGEDPLSAAVREIAEEVGVSDLTMIGALPPKTYTYNRGGMIQKTVHYFLFQSKSRQQVTLQRSEGISDASWILLADAKDIVGYPESNRPLLVAAEKILIPT